MTTGKTTLIVRKEHSAQCLRDLEVSITGPTVDSIDLFVDDFIVPLLLAMGYSPDNVKELFDGDE